MNVRRAALALATAAVLAVLAFALLPRRTQHPDADIQAIGDTLPPPESVNAEDAFAAVPHAPMRVPGAADDEAFGLVGDVAVSAGRVFVLDVLNHQVSQFGGDGARTGVLGRKGGGPGEFLGPVALAADEGLLYVLDERRQGIDQFDVAAGAWRRTLPLDFHAADVCAVDGRLYVLGARDGYVLHEVSAADGHVVRSFAPDSASRDVLLASYRSGGYLGCSPSGEIAFLPSLRGEVARFDAASGRLLGTVQIPGYRPVRVRPGPNGGVQFDVPGGGSHDYGGAIVPMPGGDWLVQVGRLRRHSQSQHEFESLRSYRLSAGGTMRRLDEPLPRVMAAADTAAYAVTTSPYPAVARIAVPWKESE